MYDYNIFLSFNDLTEDVSLIQASSSRMHILPMDCSVDESSPALYAFQNMYEQFFNTLNQYLKALWDDLKGVDDIMTKFMDMDTFSANYISDPLLRFFNNSNYPFKGIYGNFGASYPVLPWLEKP